MTAREDLEAVIRRQLGNMTKRPHTANECTGAVLKAADAYAADEVAAAFVIGKRTGEATATAPAATPGFAAYRAFMLTHPPNVADVETAIAYTWQAMGAKGRANWEAVAQAAVDAAIATILKAAESSAADAAAAERVRIRQMAIDLRAYAVTASGKQIPFEEFLRHSPEENAAALLKIIAEAADE